MINLEQVKLLETKVARAVEYVQQLIGDNAALQKDNAALLQKEADTRAKLESCQQRIDELEVLVMRFKEDQGRIEDGILAALDRLNQFEIAIDKSLKDKTPKPAAPPKVEPAPKTPPAPAADVPPGEIFFEIPDEEGGDDINDPLAELDSSGEDSPAENGELEIF